MNQTQTRTAGGVIVAIIFIAGAIALNNGVAGRSTAVADPAPIQSSAPQITTYTKDTFANAVVGKTMAQVREVMGAPSNVLDSGPDVNWYYWSDRVRVVDTDSGTPVNSAKIIFDAQTKTAESVGF